MRCLLGLLPLLAVVSAYAEITVYHTVTSVQKGTTRQFTAYVPHSPNTVVWSVNGSVGGNSTYGTVTQTGLYTAPSIVPAANVVFVAATSTAYPTISGKATVTITQPRPYVWSAYPASVAAGSQVELTVNGSGLIPEGTVTLNNVPFATTYVSGTVLKARGTFPSAGTYAVRVVQPNPGTLTSSETVNITVSGAAPVTISPSSATVTFGQTQQFTANTAVTWTVNAGMISPTGLFTAPASVPTGTQVVVRATSTADATRFATVAVTLQAAAPSVTVTPSSATVTLGATQQFTSSTAVNWTATAGAISSTGLYTAPSTMPASSAVTIRATSTMDATRFATATVTLQAAPAPAVTVSPATAGVTLGATQQFTANTAVNWTATAGTISASGLYTAPAAMPASSAVTIRATSTTDATRFATAAVTLQAAPTPPSAGLLSAARLLEQAGFGPTPQALASVQQMPAAAYVDQQLSLPETEIPLPGSMSIARAQLLSRLATAPDQLRQRVMWALSQIIVISGNKNVYPDEVVPYYRLLSKHAFGNYRTLLREITLSPQMGKYLDLANSNKPGVGGGANENFPRELLQLFSIGLTELNLDGSPKSGNPAYTQADVRQFALALTGWTYPTAPGEAPRANNWENFSQAQMEARPDNHDTSAKTLLNGVVLPAGQTVQQDLDGVIDCVFNHPNVGPFIATRLIRSLVTSNPSPAFIARIATVFNNNGLGVRGDLRAVVRAILLDPEARNDTAPPNGGRLKDPVYAYISFVRALGGSIAPTTQQVWIFDRMGQPIAAPPSVFGYYSPNYRMPGNPALFGPEFQIYTPTESVLLGNEFNQMLGSPNGDPRIDLTPFQAVAGDLNQLLDLVNSRLFYGRLSGGMRGALQKAVQASYDNSQRVFTALYLSALSGHFAVQY
jgi:uncharacterized protein (DUF1800 family)